MTLQQLVQGYGHAAVHNVDYCILCRQKETCK
jgi:hypothetical protein